MEQKRHYPVKFQREIGEKITSFGRNLLIIDREVRPEIRHKKDVEYILNNKYYKYRCLNCGNEDWIVEYSLGEKTHSGCNACCTPPKKIVYGINDATTTAPWMVKYFKDIEDAKRLSQTSKEKVCFVCPYCGREYYKPVVNVYAAKTLACVCGDGISYPNKYMYSLLEQLKLKFESEKVFDWSDGKRYDFYVEYKDNKIIIEMNGEQHYKDASRYGWKTLDEERKNDEYKKQLAKDNGIDCYFSIDASKSDNEYIKSSIIESGLLNYINSDDLLIDWDKCDIFAMSNFVKKICDYLSNHDDKSMCDAAEHFNLSVTTVLKYANKGKEYGWLNYDVKSVVETKISDGLIDRHQKPIYCATNDTYYRSASEVAKSLSTTDKSFYSRQIRKSIERGGTYFNHKFTYITREEFNNAKTHYPEKAVGNLFL